MQLKVEYEHGETAVLKNVVSYQPMPEDKPMDFTEAVKAMKLGNKVKRVGWESWLELDDDNSVTYVAPNNMRLEWRVALQDLEASDWWVML